ncbi:MAG TPA: M24 family metallopeptidase [Novosphingobium sp.]|nr:M24 family metallopeptidase [Novosphingobium sp.]
MQPHEARLAHLRAELARQGLDGFVIPISDEHMSEYVGAYAQRLEWLTGFGGSAGTAVVLKDRAAIFVDGRYTLQVRDQVDGRLYDHLGVPTTSPVRWLAEQAPEGARIGYDPWLHTGGWADGLAKALAARGAEAVAVAANPVDAVWADRPAPGTAPALPHLLAQAGEASADKRVRLATALQADGLDAAVIAALDSLAWLLNLRGSDVACTPVALGFGLLHADGTVDLFIAPEKVGPDLVAHLGDGVRIAPREGFVPALQALGGQRVGVDGERCVAAISAALAAAGARIVAAQDPCVLPKAIKNAAEQAGHRAAQQRDGAAVARFLHWLSVAAPAGTISEIAAAEALHQFRRDTGLLRDLSFETISGAGPNGAIVHYRVSEETNRLLAPGSVYLVDSGGQYADGTTDITRTVWIGPGAPDAELKDRFTRVLKGHIALARAVFPAGTAGSQLDTLARQHLWAAGLDYAHGTGHGVGSFLAVHEGPQRIAKAAGGQAGTGQALLAGMILSNEPGYYKAGAYGIRIENLVLVEPRAIPGAEGACLGFETLTHVPIERALIAPALLLPEERAWLDAYHAATLALLAPLLEGAALAWLEAQCAPL